MYEEGQSFVPKGDCNQCICQNGRPGVCTKAGCPEPLQPEKLPCVDNNGKDRKAGEKWMEDCQDCHCDGDGMFSCHPTSQACTVPTKPTTHIDPRPTKPTGPIEITEITTKPTTHVDPRPTKPTGPIIITDPTPSTTNPKPTLPCPNHKVNLQQRKDVNMTRKVMTMTACSALCKRRPDCKYWIWAHGKAGHWSYGCWTMSGFGYSNADNNVVSGSRDCAGVDPKPTKPTAKPTTTKPNTSEGCLDKKNVKRKVGESWKNNCNTCWCKKGRRWFSNKYYVQCTHRYCPPSNSCHNIRCRGM